MGKFEPLSIKVSALQEYERLRRNSIFENIEQIIVTVDSITVLLLNVRSPSKHACDIKSVGRLMSNVMMCYISQKHSYGINICQIALSSILKILEFPSTAMTTSF